MFLSSLSFLSFLINYEFWSRVGFFISYIVTFLLVLEIVRLASTDANRKEVEKLLDAYSASRSQTPPRRTRKVSVDELVELQSQTHPSPHTMKVSIDDLVADMAKSERQRRTRTPSPAVAPESGGDEERRRRRTRSSSTSPQPHPQASSSPRRLRKRSDTLNSSSSAESKGVARRRREDSPASSSGAMKVSSRHASPTPRSKEAVKLSSSLHKMLRTKA